ncbi:hypothetical protein [Aerosakkonema funiforme]|uniref:Uncharacterized protein n=1 Tax=Aerosakkonema funiforme FACHB-1375 TaxID=2949571 RepID=A0A926ZKF3_9CYAN|nr:hypothetical protein [Aerosakkonema funiforme]MBD2185724.1 hypothetical protein [Aerosakkonema funiforme FACHB-1375]
MKYTDKLAKILGIILFLLVSISSLHTQAQSITEVRSNPTPNKVLNVISQAGNCPKNVGIWIISFAYMQEIYNIENIVIADTLPIAGPAKVATKRFRFVEYQAPLRSPYTSCVGQANFTTDPNSLDASYKFRFQNRNVYFTIDITNIPDGFGAGIKEEKILGLRPYAVVQFVD